MADPKKLSLSAKLMIGGFTAAVFLVLLVVVFPPRQGPPPETIKDHDDNQTLSVDALQIKDLLARAKIQEENLQKLYNNQVKFNDSVASMLRELEAQRKAAKENRAYLAMLYQKVLDLEMQMQNLGGGYNVRPKGKEDPINPMIGDTLPENP